MSIGDSSGSLKDQKEAFVSGLNGTTVSEILLVCSSAPIGIFLFHELRNYFSLSSHYHYQYHYNHDNKKEKKPEKAKAKELPNSALILIESLTVLFPMALCQTELLYPYGVMVLSCELLLALILHTFRRYHYRCMSYFNCSGNGNDASANAIVDTTNCVNLLGCLSNGSADSSNSTDSNINPKILTSPSQSRGMTTPTAVGKSKLNYQNQNLYPFLTFYRSTVSYLTFVAILAVDFTIFPRAFAKTEVYGYGLMDLGAASFCILGGLVSWFARQQPNSTPATKHFFSKNTTNPSSNQRMKKVLRNIIPLLIMGFVRLITTKGLEYQEHVSEYGIHWNFFFTLALVNIITTAIRSYGKKCWGGVGVVPILPWIFLLIVYQLMLSLGEVQEYIVDAPRTCQVTDKNTSTSTTWWNVFYICDLFAANREGLLGCIGYTILFLASEDIGRYCLWSISKTSTTNTTTTAFKEKSSKNPNSSLLQGRRLLFTTIVFWYLHWISSSSSISGFGIPASRRSTNGTFVLWTLAHNMTILLLIWLSFHYGADRPMIATDKDNNNDGDNSSFFVQRRGSGNASDLNVNMNMDMNIVAMNPPIFAAVNRHGLIVFILANLMTGIVNLSINTLEASRGVAIIVIFLYLCSIGAVALIIDKVTSDRILRLKKK